MKGHNKQGSTSASGWDKATKGSFSNNLGLTTPPQQSMPASTLSAMPRYHSTNSFGVFLNDNATKLNYVYRGTSSAPENKFSSGFTVRGNNLNLSNHINNWPSNSAYVSASLSKNAAASYAIDQSSTGFVYEINPPNPGVNVENHLYNEFLEGRLKKTHFQSFLSDHEISIPQKIAPHDIKGAWKVESFTETTGLETFEIKNDFIPNPEYRPSPAVRVAHVGKALGHAAIAVGAGLDIYNLITSVKDDRFLKEATRVAAGWSVAAALSGAPAEACATIGGAVAGPAGALIGGVGCGALGSAIGYLGASQMVEKGLSKDTIGNLNTIETQAMDREFLMSPKDPVTNPQKRLASIAAGLKKLENAKVSEKTKQYSVPYAQMTSDERITSACATGITGQLQQAMRDPAQTPNHTLLFSCAKIIDNYNRPGTQITQALFDAGARCSRDDAYVLRSAGEHNTANLCTLPPSSNSQYRRKY